MGLMFRPAENETIDVRILFNSLKSKFSNYTSFFGLHIYAFAHFFGILLMNSYDI